MKVKEIKTPKVAFVRSDDSIKQAALKMEELGVGALPVVVGEDVVGMLTDRDIVIRTVAQGLDAETHKVADALTEGVVSCKEGDDVGTVVDLMEKEQVRRVVVKDEQQNVTGIVSLGDLALNIQKEMAGEALKGVSQPV